MSQADASLLSRSLNKKRAAQVRCLFRCLLEQLPGAIKKLRHCDLLKKLESMHLCPFAAVTVEHMLCEFRKVNQKRVVNDEGTPKLRTPSQEFQALWQIVQPIYAQRAKICSSLSNSRGKSPRRVGYLRWTNLRKDPIQREGNQTRSFCLEEKEDLSLLHTDNHLVLPAVIQRKVC